jgi:hypothetical protein
LKYIFGIEPNLKSESENGMTNTVIVTKNLDQYRLEPHAPKNLSEQLDKPEKRKRSKLIGDTPFFMGKENQMMEKKITTGGAKNVEGIRA